MIRPYAKPLREKAGFLVLSGNLFDSALIKTSVISPEFRQRYLSQARQREPLRRPGHRVRGHRRIITRASMIRRWRSMRIVSS